jgi:hypothetical protein
MSINNHIGKALFNSATTRLEMRSLSETLPITGCFSVRTYVLLAVHFQPFGIEFELSDLLETSQKIDYHSNLRPNKTAHE